MTGARGRAGCRRFTLLDAMILVGGLAVAIAGAREYLPLVLERGGVLWAHRLGLYFLTAVAILLLTLRLRRPRPAIRRVARQPGAVACFAVAASQAITAVDWVVESASKENLEFFVGNMGWTWALLGDHDRPFVVVVPIAWAILALGGRWRPEPGWVDASGRAVGWALVACAVAKPLLDWAASRYEWLQHPVNIM